MYPTTKDVMREVYSRRDNINYYEQHNEQHYKEQNKQHLKITTEVESNESVTSSSGLPPLVEKQSLPSGGGTGVTQAIALPPLVKSIKVDLFDNATDEEAMLNKRNFKISLNMIVEKPGAEDDIRTHWNSSLMGRSRDFRYNRKEQNQMHFNLAWNLYEDLKVEQQLSHSDNHLMVSKFYEVKQGKDKGKGKTVPHASVVFQQLNEGYRAWIILDEMIICADLSTKAVTNRQRRNNCIATWQRSNSQRQSQSVDIKSLLWGE